MPAMQEILDMVERKETNSQPLRKRWDSDYSKHWILDDYQEADGRGVGFRQYSSNESRTNAKKAIGMISAAQMKLIVPQGNDPRETRDDDNKKEQFLRGNFRANDQRLIRLGEKGGGPLQQQLAFYLNVRGTTVGRCLLRRRGGTGRAIADATPFDPRDCFWEYGPDGLDWFIHRYSMFATQAEREWRFDREDKDTEVFTVYDYLDVERNIVIIPDAKDKPVKDEVHGLVDGDNEPQTPAWVMANTLQPAISSSLSGHLSSNQIEDSMLHFGESIFADGRHQYETWNFITGIRLELAGRSRKPMFGIVSESGVKLVENSPFEEGAEIPLKIGEKLEVYDFLQTAGDTDPLSGVISSEQQKAGFPAVSFGSLPDPVSGFAITQLKGGTADKVMGAAQAGGAALMQIADIWCDHFATRAFGGMELSGEGRNRKWFSGFIDPDDIQDLPQAQITLIPELPENLSEKIQNAIALRTPGPDGNPLESDHMIREDWLNRDDSDMDADAVMAQMAAQDPAVQAIRMVDALAKRGDFDGARAWNNKFRMIMREMEQILLQAGIDPNDDTGIDTNPETAGFSPQVLPRESQGLGSPTVGADTPFQEGPNVLTGTPRPGARNNNQPDVSGPGG